MNSLPVCLMTVSINRAASRSCRSFHLLSMPAGGLEPLAVSSAVPAPQSFAWPWKKRSKSAGQCNASFQILMFEFSSRITKVCCSPKNPKSKGRSPPISSLKLGPFESYSNRMDKDQVAEILTNIATLLDLKGENPFKSRAYVTAARALESVSEPLDKLIAEKRLSGIRGIGDSIVRKIVELIST